MSSDLWKCMGTRRMVWTVMLGTLGLGACPMDEATAGPGDSIVTVQFVDSVASQYDPFVTMAVYITSYDVPVAGINLRLAVSRPDLLQIPDSAVQYPLLDFTGSAISGWDFKDENRITEVVLNIGAINNLPGGSTPAPLPPSPIPYRICSFKMQRVAPISVMDTLQDRAVQVFAQVPFCSFSDPSGNLIGMRDTTSGMYDANEYIPGTLTFGPPCVSRGDVNLTGTINSADIIFLVNYVFKGGQTPACGGVSGDVNCTGVVNSADIIYLVNFVFKSGTPPC